jgi:hypothetical protein
MLTFHHRDCPSNLNFIEYIKKNTPWEDAVNSVSYRDTEPQNLFVKSITNYTEILDEILFLYNTVGSVYWRSQDSKSIYGLSLSYNPENDPIDWKCASFGHPRYKKFSNTDYFAQPNKDQHTAPKNDYLDSYGFRKLLPEINSCFELLNLFESFSSSILRVTSRTIDGSYCFPSYANNGGMHKDDSIFEMVRLNICLSTDGNFGLQYIDKDPVFPTPGEMYAINSNVEHRVYVNNFTNFQRTHLVIGISPWLNYDTQSDSWTLNEYFGKVHPLDLVKQQLIFKKRI